ncbi:exodeoxyribonuclease VII small subunit [Oleidesulfovibrio sp.]|uniref:exodeoxyribonuclease VII small subunit n=1 Tax=Oleidesulfovibrio sp. TaxID=2909707 RepID=UPI003A8A7577
MSDVEKISFEAQLKRLQDIVARLETAELPLEEGVALYKEGLELAAACRKQLLTARNDIKVFSEGVLSDFELQPEE